MTMKPGMKKTALVVDDDAEIRRMLIAFLEHLRFSAIAVEDGEKALAVAEGLKPDVILLDIILPGMSGIETLRQLRKVTPESAVVMISGQTDRKIAEEALLIGAYDYIVKPLDLKFLQWLLEEKIGREEKHT